MYIYCIYIYSWFSIYPFPNLSDFTQNFPKKNPRISESCVHMAATAPWRSIRNVESCGVLTRQKQLEICDPPFLSPHFCHAQFFLSTQSNQVWLRWDYDFKILYAWYFLNHRFDDLKVSFQHHPVAQSVVRFFPPKFGVFFRRHLFAVMTSQPLPLQTVTIAGWFVGSWPTVKEMIPRILFWWQGFLVNLSIFLTPGGIHYDQEAIFFIAPPQKNA